MADLFWTIYVCHTDTNATWRWKIWARRNRPISCSGQNGAAALHYDLESTLHAHIKQCSLASFSCLTLLRITQSIILFAERYIRSFRRGLHEGETDFMSPLRRDCVSGAERCKSISSLSYASFPISVRYGCGEVMRERNTKKETKQLTPWGYVLF